MGQIAINYGESKVINQAIANEVIPMAVELNDAELDNLFGGGCGCGWVCTYTGECGCPNGRTVCWPCHTQEQ